MRSATSQSNGLEWNGIYRDSMRTFREGEGGLVGDLGSPLTVERRVPGWRPQASASIDFITAHDGFTLRDLVSYNQKHNEANKENNGDGHTATAPGTAARKGRAMTLP